MRCPRCGNENPEGNRFCGMCGATILAAEVPAAQAQRATAVGSSTSTPAPPVRPRTSEPPRPASDDRPTISGPSFLGLSDPAPRKPNAGLSIDPHASSGNLDYLLDDEESRGSGAGKVFLILIALALAVGFGYLRWKGHGFGWLTSTLNKPSAVAKNPDAAESDSSAASNAPPDSQTPPANQPARETRPASAPANSITTDNGGTPSAASPSTVTPTSPAPASATPATTPAPKSDRVASAPVANNAVADDNPDTSNSEDADSKGTAEKPAAAEPVAPKPKPVAKPTRPSDPVAEAQKYLYGRGSAQDCDRGLRLLKPAANAANPKAMVEMGALYSAGLCTPHDLPTAYRWFAMALRKDPENQAIQTDLKKLWGEMTQPERQLAIKLTQ